MQISSLFPSNQISQYKNSQKDKEREARFTQFFNNAHEDETGPSVKQQETSLKSSSFTILDMLLESLFLAELEEGKAPTSDANDDPAMKQQMQEKPNNLLKDGGKVAEIKRVIEDFSTGKVNLSDLPKAMSSGKSETHGAALKNTNVSGKDDTKKD